MARIWRKEKVQFGNDYLGWIRIMSIQSRTILIKTSHVFCEEKAMSQLQDNLYEILIITNLASAQDEEIKAGCGCVVVCWLLT